MIITNKVKCYYLFIFCSSVRGAATETKAKAKAAAGAKHSDSFTLNLFRGRFETAQVFPYPDPLTDDQRQTLQELVPPVEKFFQEVREHFYQSH